MSRYDSSSSLQTNGSDLNADGKIDANELPNPKAADGNEDHAIDRKELEDFYYFVLEGIENRKQRKP